MWLDVLQTFGPIVIGFIASYVLPMLGIPEPVTVAIKEVMMWLFSLLIARFVVKLVSSARKAGMFRGI
jgi:hypothetical protein